MKHFFSGIHHQLLLSLLSNNKHVKFLIRVTNSASKFISEVIPSSKRVADGKTVVFDIILVPGYVYNGLDFGATDGVLSSDGKTLTVTATKDETIVLIKMREEQEWLDEVPSIDAIQEEFDKQLNDIPRDGNTTRPEIKKISKEDYFYYLQISNNVTAMVSTPVSAKRTVNPNSREEIRYDYANGYDDNSVDTYLYYKKDECHIPNTVISNYFGADIETPDGYVRYREIASTGTVESFIDLGIKLKVHDHVQLVFYANSFSRSSDVSRGLFGNSWTSNDTGNYCVFTPYDGWYYQYQARYYRKGNVQPYIDYDTYLICDCKNGTITFTNASTGVQKSTGTATFSNMIDSPDNCLLFGVNGGNGKPRSAAGNPCFIGRIQYFKVFDENEVLSHCFIPVRQKSTSKYGLVDTVTGAFIETSLSRFSFGGPVTDGEWTKVQKGLYRHEDSDIDADWYSMSEHDCNAEVNIPSEFQKLEYVMNEGIAVLNTGVTLTTADDISCIASIAEINDQNYKALFGARNGSTSSNFCMFTRFNSVNIPCYARFNQELKGTTLEYDKVIRIKTSSKNLFIESLSGALIDRITITSGTDSGTGSNCLYLFDISTNSNKLDGSSCQGRIYSFKIYRNNILTHHFVPAQSIETGMVGMYDTVAKKFIPPLRDSLIAGPAIGVDRRKTFENEFDYNADIELSDEYQKIQYVENTSNAYIDTQMIPAQHEMTEATIYIKAPYSTSNFAMWGNNYSLSGEVFYIRYSDYSRACYYPGNTEILLHGIVWDDICKIRTQTNVPLKGSVTMLSASGFKINVATNNYEGNYSTRNAARYIFANNGSSGAQYNTKGRIYSFRVLSDDGARYKSVLIPAVRKSDNAVGLFDVSRNLFLTSANSTALIAGPSIDGDIPLKIDYTPDITVPEEYKKQSYIYTSLRSYLNLGVKWKAEYKVEILNSFTFFSDCPLGYLIGWPDGTSYGAGIRIHNNEGTSYRWQYMSYIRSGNYVNASYNREYRGAVVKTIADGANLDFYDLSGTRRFRVTNSTALKDSTGDMLLFAIGNGSGGVNDNNIGRFTRVYYIKIFDSNNDLVHCFVPVIRKTDLMRGMYDTINGIFVQPVTDANNMKTDDYFPIVAEPASGIPSGKDYSLLLLKKIMADLVVTIAERPFDALVLPGDMVSQISTMTGMTLENYFYYIKLLQNSAKEYVDIDSTMKTVLAGRDQSFALTYKNGYDEEDIRVSNGTLSGDQIDFENVQEDESFAISKYDGNKKYITEIEDSQVETGSSVIKSTRTDYFYYVKVVNENPEICTPDASVKTELVGEDISFTLSFSEGYDLSDISCTFGQLLEEDGVSKLKFEELDMDYVTRISFVPTSIVPITEDTELMSSSTLRSAIIEDYFFYLRVINDTNGVIENIDTHTESTFAIPVRKNDSVNLGINFAQKHYESEIDLSGAGYIEWARYKIDSMVQDEVVHIVDNTYHVPTASTDEDPLGLFDVATFAPATMSQGMLIQGNNELVNNYVFYTRQPSTLSDKKIWSVDNSVDLIGTDPATAPGKTQVILERDDDDMTEVLLPVVVDGIDMYRHVVTLKRQLILSPARQYIFKIRTPQSDTIVAAATGSSNINIMNYLDDYYIQSGNYYFDWYTPGKFVYRASKQIYFEINNKRY